MIFLKAIISPFIIILLSLCVQYIVTAGVGLNFTANESLWNHCGDWFTWKFTAAILTWAWISLVVPVGSVKTRTVGDNSGTASYKVCTLTVSTRRIKTQVTNSFIFCQQDSGVLFYWLTLVFFFLLQALYPTTSISMYHSMPKFTGTLNTTCILLSIVLLFKVGW